MRARRVAAVRVSRPHSVLALSRESPRPAVSSAMVVSMRGRGQAMAAAPRGASASARRGAGQEPVGRRPLVHRRRDEPPRPHRQAEAGFYNSAVVCPRS